MLYINKNIMIFDLDNYYRLKIKHLERDYEGASKELVCSLQAYIDRLAYLSKNHRFHEYR